MARQVYSTPLLLCCQEKPANLRVYFIAITAPNVPNISVISEKVVLLPKFASTPVRDRIGDIAIFDNEGSKSIEQLADKLTIEGSPFETLKDFFTAIY